MDRSAFVCIGKIFLDLQPIILADE